MPTRKRVGGSFAPPIDDAKLDAYEALGKQEGGQVGEIMADLVEMLREFRKTPDSTLPGKPHLSGAGVIVPLEEAEITRLWDLVPWPSECDMYGKVLDALPAGETRNAAYHLLWFARELTADREPITNDKL